MFLIGIPLYGTMTLLPLMLQNLMNYPVVTTGLVTAPRGIGTMVAMFLVGRLVGRVDTRLIILTGLLATVVSMWQMTGFSLQMGMAPIITSGVLQGFGLGFVFTPLSIITFSTLPRHIAARGRDLQPDAEYRRQHQHLGRRGAAVENTQIVHSRLVEHCGPTTRWLTRPTSPLLQPQHDLRDCRAQRRGDAAGADGGLCRHFKLMMIIVRLGRAVAAPVAQAGPARSLPAAAE